MHKVINRLDSVVASIFSDSEELWVAVGLLTESGLRQVQENLHQGASVRLLVGVDMPTPPSVLAQVLKLQAKGQVTCRIYDGPGYFHPKVYLARDAQRWTAYVGSANLTAAALSRNVEMTLATAEQAACAQLRSWFEHAFAESLSLSQSIILAYEEAFDPEGLSRLASGRMRRGARRALRAAHDEVLADRTRLVSAIERKKTTHPVPGVTRRQKEAIGRIRTALDYPGFKHIDLDGFFQETALGHLIAVSKPRLERNIKGLRQTLLAICDEGAPIAERYQRAIRGDLKVSGAGPNLLSKVLTIHRPDLYGVINGPALDALVVSGIPFPKGLSPGERYAYATRNLQAVAKEAKIPNLAVLDYYLWLISHEGA